LTTSIVKEDIGIRVKNIAQQPVSDYYITVADDVHKSISISSAFSREGAKEILKIINVGHDTIKQVFINI
jgi:oligosaccharyltransferase complex subunit alpha (ribophorin I)